MPSTSSRRPRLSRRRIHRPPAQAHRRGACGPTSTPGRPPTATRMGTTRPSTRPRPLRAARRHARSRRHRDADLDRSLAGRRRRARGRRVSASRATSPRSCPRSRSRRLNVSERPADRSPNRSPTRPGSSSSRSCSPRTARSRMSTPSSRRPRRTTCSPSATPLRAPGVHPFDASRFDFTGCHTYKWLCSPRGVGVHDPQRARRSTAHPDPRGLVRGRRSRWTNIYGPAMNLATDAREFDVSPAWQAWIGAEQAIELFADLDIAEVWERTSSLGDALCDGLGIPQQHQAIVTWPDESGGDVQEARRQRHQGLGSRRPPARVVPPLERRERRGCGAQDPALAPGRLSGGHAQSARLDHLAREASRLRLPGGGDLRRFALGVGLRPPRHRAEGEHQARVVEVHGAEP